MLKSDIMIVDDNPANLKLLEDMLVRQGHQVRSFPLGRLALAGMTKSLPDLILLDVNMPEMNGYEVCQRLKASPEFSKIPVIFLSALNDTDDKVKGFRGGAVDYITKPFHFEEVEARVETHLTLHNLEKALQLQNEQLERTVADRTRELAEANQRLTIIDRSKDDFLRLISHELRTPLNGLIGAAELILKGTSSVKEYDELGDMFRRSRQRMLSILNDALVLTEIDMSEEHFKSAQVSLDTVLHRAIVKATEFATSRQVTLRQPKHGLDLVLGDEELLVKAFHALLETAVKFSQEGEMIRLFYLPEVNSGWLTVMVESSGSDIPIPQLAKFFDIFSTGEAITRGGDLGLGPPVALRILSLFGGTVSVANQVPPGIRLTVCLKHITHNNLH